MFKYVTCLTLVLSLSVGAEDVKPVSLAQAQRFAIENNHQLRIAESQVAQARAKKFQTWAGHLPWVKLTESGIRTNDAVQAFGMRLKQERFTQADFSIVALNDPAPITNFQTQLEIRQPLFLGGETLYGRKAATMGVKASEAQLVRQAQLVRFETARAYWGAVLAQEALRAVQKGLETAQKHATQTEVRYREETADMADVLAARVRVAELEGEALRASNVVANARDNLILVMGLNFDDGLTLTDSLMRKPVPNDLERLLDVAQKHRPDFQAAQLQEKATGYGVGVARAKYIPQVSAFATFAFDSEDLLKREGESWLVGGQVSWDIFSGGQTLGKVREAKATHLGARAAVEFKQTDVIREVRASYRNVMAANAQVDIAQRAVGHSEERLRIAQLQYREGLSTSLDLLTAESDLRRTRVLLLQALYLLNLGLSELEVSVGQTL
jgi:outer membrane protein TolC